MKKEKLKEFLTEYWYDDKFLKEKTKEMATFNKLLTTNESSIFNSSKQYEEDQIKRIFDKKYKIENLFQQLKQPHRTIMYMKYISFLTFDQIAVRMNYSTKRIYQLHNDAMESLLTIINDKNISKN